MSNNSIPKNTVDFYFKPGTYYPGDTYLTPQNSWKLVSWIAQFSSLKGSAKLVSIQVASYYSNKNKYAHPSYETLAEATGLGYGTVSRAVKEMKLSGEWIILSTAYKDSLRKTNNRYFALSPLEGEFDEAKKLWTPRKHSSIDSYNYDLKSIRNEWRKI